MKNSGLPFFLTGGTALSRFYFNHRFSDDLDFFVNDNPGYSGYVSEFEHILNANAAEMDFQVLTGENLFREQYSRISVRQKDVVLKVDMVNDVPFRVGTPWISEKAGLIDNWQNILTNKISAIYRFAAKDLSDLWVLSKNYSFNWKEILLQAKEKEMGTDASMVASVIRTMPEFKFSEVIWTENPGYKPFMDDLNEMARDIMNGADNSLCQI